jgi:hypothetical protein
LRLHRNRRVATAQFAALGVERVVVEYELHISSDWQISGE